LVLAVLFFVAAGFLGRATIIDGRSLSLIWPAAGVAGVWIGSGTRRTLPFDFLALAVATYAVNAVTGAPAALAAVLVVTNLVQVGLFVVLIRAWIGDLWGFGGSRPMQRLEDLGRLVAAATLACLCAALLGALGLHLVNGSVPASAFLVWWGRNTVALILIVTLCVLVLQPFATAAPGSRFEVLRAALRKASTGRLIETAVFAGISVGITLVMFLEPRSNPLMFLLLVATAWAGLRFPPVAVTLHGLTTGAIGIGFTLAGVGPFAAIESLQYRALVAQVFLAMTVLTGLALSFSRAERDHANRELAVAQRAADQRAKLLDAVLETMTEGVVVVDADHRVLVRNNAARRLVGLTDDGSEPDRLRETADYGLFHPSGLPLRHEELPALRALAGEDVEPADFHLRSPAVPQGRVLEITARPIEDDDPTSARRAMINLRDVTLDRQHRDTLASFAGVVAHDLFNPLALIEGWAENLEAEFSAGAVLASTGLPMVARIHTAADHMREVIADLLAYTVARDQSLRRESVDLSSLVRGLAKLRANGPTAPVIAVADDLRAWADPGMMRQLFDNLLGNAIKYVDHGIRPAIDIAGEADGEILRIRMTDNGIGIPLEHREQVFETFHRAHDGYNGSGLGLAICHRIVDRHGGSITIEEGPNGIGSTFVITLPLTPTGAAEPVASEASGFPVLSPFGSESVTDLAE
jgi:signal transduction histidine kinase